MDRGKVAGGRGTSAERSVEDDVDALFRLPLAEFTAARNALAARLKRAGRADHAGEVKALSKPPMSAWAVNQLYWRNRDAFDRLITTGEQFRKAQAAQLAGRSADLRGPLEARRSALANLSRLAASLLRDGGSQAAPDTMRRVTTTLEALSAYGEVPNAPRAGRLTDDADPPGFETLAALVPTLGKARIGGEPTRIIPFQQKAGPAKPSKRKATTEEEAKRAEDERRAQLATARAAVQEAERTLRDARRSAQDAEAALKKAAARAKEAEKTRADAEQTLEKAAAESDAARRQARTVAADAEDAAQAVADAERALEKARTDLKALS